MKHLVAYAMFFALGYALFQLTSVQPDPVCPYTGPTIYLTD